MTLLIRQLKPIVVVLIVGAVAVLGAAASRRFFSHRPEWSITIATASPGGTFYPLGNQLARILARLPGGPIEHVEAQESAGSQDNIQRLINSEANVALVMGPALVEAGRGNAATLQELRVLARLYVDVVHIVVRKNIGIETITDLKNRKIFIGAEGSGTRVVVTQILEAIGLSEGSYMAEGAGSFTDAANKLVGEELEAAFFAAGTPTEAVQKALESGEVELLTLDGDTRRHITTSDVDLALEEVEIPANFYPNQPEQVETMGADVFLVCRRDLPEDLAFLILDALFDNIADLRLAHAKAQGIKLTRAFEVPGGFLMHSAATEFEEAESDRLLVATGAINGKYYQLGRTIESLLEEHGIPARFIHTDGSLENADLLRTRPTIAIMQYDAALASRFGQPRFVYNVDLPETASIPEVRNIRRIASLHQEKVHVITRREKLVSIEEKLNERHPESEQGAITTLSELAQAVRKLSPSEERLRVSLGPERSGTQVVAQAILKHHGIDSTSIIPSFLPVLDMVNRLYSEEIDVGFFVSYVPSEALKTILNDGRIKLLSLGHEERAPMTATVFATSTIEPGMYASQREDEPGIETISTRAVLVTTEDLPFDVETITEAIFEGQAFLGIQGGGDSMAADLPSLPLHPDAKRYYQDAGYLPSKHAIDWLTPTWRTLAILVILISGCKGLLMLRRESAGNEIGRRILSVPLEASVLDSARRLLAIRTEIEQRVRRRWWRPGELDKPRWRYLRDLIDDRSREAKEALARKLLANIRDVTRDPDLDETTRRQRYGSIERRVWESFEDGKLESLQQEMLCELLRERDRLGAK